MSFLYISSLACFIGNLIIGVAVYLINPKKLINFVFAIFSICLAFWTLGDFFHLTFLANYSLIFWVRLANVAAAFCPPLFVHFVILFSQSPLFRRKIAYFYLLSLILALFAAFSPLYIASVSSEKGALMIESGILYYLFIAYVVIGLIMSIYMLLREYKRAVGFLKYQIQYFFVAIFVTISALLIYFPAVLGFNVPRLDNLFLLFFICVIAYSITKHRLMDISVVISRTMAHVLAVIFFGSIYLVLLLFYRQYVSSTIDFGFFLVTVIYGIFVGEYFQRIRIHIQTTAEKLILKGEYDYSKVLMQISRDLSRVVSREEIEGVAQRDMREFLDVSKAGVWYVGIGDKKNVI